ncbi:MAG: hypothetical protein HKN48_10795 [Flavobacteriaceae bacterium]|nr:hypothetical protein [Flavobacteriaceae bacterium]
MKTILFLIFFVVLTTSVLSQEHDCDYFKTGQFRISDKEIGYEGMIERDDNFQTEYTKGTGFISKYKVNWIDDCNYELLLVESNNPASKGSEDTSYLVSILEIKGLDVIIEIAIPGNDNLYQFTMTKIE